MKKIRRYLQGLRYIVPTLYFNFHYLPFKQAIRLPIILYKPHLIRMRGKIKLDPKDGKIHHGMVKLGFCVAHIYPNNGITWENNGGTVIFQGLCIIGNDSYLSVGPSASVSFGHGFESNAAFKIVSYKGITLGQYVSFGWDCIVMDTNFHPLYDIEKKEYCKGSGQIKIGDYNWFGTGCRLMHSVTTPERCIFGAGTIVTHSCVKKPYCLMGGLPVRVLRENVIRVFGNEKGINVVKPNI